MTEKRRKTTYAWDIGEKAIRTEIDIVIHRLQRAGHCDAAARLELVREYGINAGFRKALHDMLWANYSKDKFFIGDRVEDPDTGVQGTVVVAYLPTNSAPISHDPEWPYVRWDPTRNVDRVDCQCLKLVSR